MAAPAHLDHETEREYCWRAFPNDAREILRKDQTRSSQCKQPLCRAQIWWGYTAANDKRCPFDIKPDGTRTGTSHWRTCRQRPERGGGANKKEEIDQAKETGLHAVGEVRGRLPRE